MLIIWSSIATKKASISGHTNCAAPNTTIATTTTTDMCATSKTTAHWRAIKTPLTRVCEAGMSLPGRVPISAHKNARFYFLNSKHTKPLLHITFIMISMPQYCSKPHKVQEGNYRQKIRKEVLTPDGYFIWTLELYNMDNMFKIIRFTNFVLCLIF